MKLKGLVWFFAIALILISIYQLSFTWVVNSHENKMKQKAEQMIKRSNPGVKGEEKEELVKRRLQRLLDSTRDVEIYPLLGTTYQKSKEKEVKKTTQQQLNHFIKIDFICDNCQRKFIRDTVYSSAPNLDQLSDYSHYCVDCLET